MAIQGPYKLVTVNTAPARAKILIGRVIEDMRDQYIINYTTNVERIEEVREVCEKEKPDVLFCASMWTKEESDEIQRIARETVPGVKTMAIPEGLQVEQGPDAVVEYLKKQWPILVASPKGE